jgi:hypothetical protein
MKSLPLLITALLVLTSSIFSQEFIVKSLDVYTSNNETALPVYTGDNKLVIEFDVQGEWMPNMNVVFRFCDKGWTPTNNIFLLNTGYSTKYFLDFEELPVSVIEDARYHNKSTYPDDRGEVRFPFSGKWRFYITDTQDSSIVYATGKFYVAYSQVDMDVVIARDELEDQNYWPTQLAKRFSLTADFYLPEEFYPAFVDKMEIIDNQRVYYPIEVDRNTNTLFRFYKWDANRHFTFTARDIPAGKVFRQVDIRNPDLYSGRDFDAQLDGLEYSRFFLDFRYNDLNGGKIYENFRDAYSTYHNVTFSIRPPDDVYGDIFLVGAFNNWLISPDYQLFNNNGIYSTIVTLKRGVYDYQYVVGEIENDKVINADWLILEGNNWNNRKEFDVFLYYNEQDKGGYERIIGYKRVRNL